MLSRFDSQEWVSLGNTVQSQRSGVSSAEKNLTRFTNAPFLAPITSNAVHSFLISNQHQLLTNSFNCIPSLKKYPFACPNVARVPIYHLTFHRRKPPSSSSSRTTAASIPSVRSPRTSHASSLCSPSSLVALACIFSSVCMSYRIKEASNSPSRGPLPIQLTPRHRTISPERIIEQTLFHSIRVESKPVVHD